MLLDGRATAIRLHVLRNSAQVRFPCRVTCRRILISQSSASKRFQRVDEVAEKWSEIDVYSSTVIIALQKKY